VQNLIRMSSLCCYKRGKKEKKKKGLAIEGKEKGGKKSRDVSIAGREQSKRHVRRREKRGRKKEPEDSSCEENYLVRREGRGKEEEKTVLRHTCSRESAY